MKSEKSMASSNWIGRLTVVCSEKSSKFVTVKIQSGFKLVLATDPDF